MRRVLLPGATLVLSSLYEFLFTPVCCHCGARLSPGEGYLCRACSESLPVLEQCDPLYRDASRRLAAGGMFDGLISLFRFEKGSPVQSLIHELKYGGRIGVGVSLGRSLGAAIASAPDIGRFSGCLPVPLHRVRRRQRGYNQSAVLCRGIREVSGMPVCESLLKRVRCTPSQTSLGSDERAANVEGAFRVRRRAGRRVSGGSFLLVDDVLTTGATMRSCASVLRRAGVRRLVACTVALAS